VLLVAAGCACASGRNKKQDDDLRSSAEIIPLGSIGSSTITRQKLDKYE
jgi:hypothetical protein